MKDLELLQQIEKKYEELLIYGLNKGRAAKCAVDEVLIDMPIKPYIYSDEMNEPYYVGLGDYKLIFGDGIYKKI